MRITLKAARVNANLTREDVAKSLNVSKKTVWSWENGKTKPNLKYVEKICDLLGRSYDEIQWKI